MQKKKCFMLTEQIGNVCCQGHHIIDRLEERDVERGSGRQFFLEGRERAIVSQTNIGTVSKDEKGSSSIRPTLELVQRMRKGHRQ